MDEQHTLQLEADLNTNDRAVSGAGAARVHLRLARVHACCWMVSAFHLLVVMRHEVFDWDGLFIFQCAAPPLIPLALLLQGRPVASLVSLAWVTAVVVVPWWFAARQPQRGWRLTVATVVAVTCWIVIDLSLGLDA